MLAKRIIPCLDIKDGRTVKGTNFKNLRDAGDPIELAAKYSSEGADELVFLDISATIEKRRTLVKLVEKIAKVIDIPFTVGGGISELDLVDSILQAGADKVSINSAAIKRPSLIQEISEKYGSQCTVVAVDAKKVNKTWQLHTKGGTHNTGLDLFEYSEEAVRKGAGELLFTSMNADGTKKGFELEALHKLSNAVSVPVIASGGAGSIDDFISLFHNTKATGGLAASIFHYKKVEIRTLKTKLKESGILVRL